MRVLLAGSHPLSSGSGMVHWGLARELPKVLRPSDEVVALPAQPTTSPEPVSTRLLRRVPPCDVVVATGVPLPLRLPEVPLVAIVYDLRWRTTRSRLASIYRGADLRRTARRASKVLTISDSSRRDLRRFLGGDPGAAVLPLGPGQVEGLEAPDPRPLRSVLLIGRGRHKRNEEAAALLAASAVARRNLEVRAISVSDAVRSTLEGAFPEERLIFRSDVHRTEMVEHLRSASAYLALGVSEGFGIPYVEAAYMGCDVIAPDIPITREVLGPDGNFLPSPDPSVGDVEAALAAWDVVRIRRLQRSAAARSWSDSARCLARCIEDVV